MNATRFRRLLLVAVAAAGLAAAGSPRTIAIDRVGYSDSHDIVSFDVTITEGVADQVNTLFVAYGTKDGGETTNGWDHVVPVARVLGTETEKHIDLAAPIGYPDTFARLFLYEGFVPTKYVSRVEFGQVDHTKKIYLDTGYKPNETTRVTAKMKVESAYWTGGGTVFGVWARNSANYGLGFDLTVKNGNGALFVRWGDGSTVFAGDVTLSPALSTDCFHDFEIGPTGVKIDDSVVQAFSPSEATFELTYTATVGARNIGGTSPSFTGKPSFASVCVYDHGQLIRQYVPVRVADGTVQFYDHVADAICPLQNDPDGAGLLGNPQVIADDFVTLGELDSASALVSNPRYKMTAVAVPSAAGTIEGPAVQVVLPGTVPAAVTAVPVAEKIVFAGWRYAGTEEIFSTEATLQLGALTADAAVEAVFSVPKTKYAFDLGSAGVFKENGQSSIVVVYDQGDVPMIPEYTITEGCYFKRWNRDLPAFVGMDDIPFMAVAMTPDMRVVRVNPAAPSTGDGKTWATALNSFEDAIDLASHGSVEIWLAGGTNELAEAVALPAHAVIRGGFAGEDGLTDEEELAGRDVETHPSVLKNASGNTAGVIAQTTAIEGTAALDGLVFANTEGHAFSCDGLAVTFNLTNCLLTAGAAMYCRGNVDMSLRFDKCQIIGLTMGGNWGRLHFDGIANTVFENCRFEDNVVSAYGVVNVSGTKSGGATFSRCVFLRNVCKNPGWNEGASCVYGLGCRFSNCRFFWNEAENAPRGVTSFTVMIGCQVMSNVVRRTGTSTAAANLVYMTDNSARLVRTTIAENLIERNQPTLASGSTIWSYIVSPAVAYGDHSRAFANSTIAANRISATVGDGVTAEAATLVWGRGDEGNYGNKYGGIANCTFYNNDVTAEIVDNSPSKTIDIYLFNTICWNDRENYRPLYSLNGGETRGFRIFDCILRNYEACEAKVYASEGVSSEDPILNAVPQIGADGQWTFPMARQSKAFHWGREVTADENLVFAVPTVETVGALPSQKMFKWNSDVAPGGTVADITDICGRERPANRFVIGSTQEYRSAGFSITVR